MRRYKSKEVDCYIAAQGLNVYAIEVRFGSVRSTQGQYSLLAVTTN
jgi:hypothetical protein